MLTIESAVERLRARPSVPLFVGEPWDPALGQAIRETPEAELFSGAAIRDPREAAAVVAGLHLWNDDFEAAHNLCQGIETATGSYWHGLCHRREGHRDRGLEANLNNTRYWFRRVGNHPAFPQVRELALQTLAEAGSGMRWATEATGMIQSRPDWDPLAMVDWFGQADAGTLSPQTAELLQRIQQGEIELLLAWCRTQAFG